MSKSKKPSTKKPAAKKAKPAKKAATPKASEKESTRGNPETSPFAYCRDLILNQKHSDEEILALITKRFPKATFNQGYISSERWTLNQALSSGKQLERLAKDEKGKLVPKSALPKKSASGKKKYTAENDPLKRVAGIDVHAKKAIKAAKPKAAQPKAATPKAAVAKAA